MEILSKVDLDSFWIKSKAILDNNRSEISKLGKIFGNQPIPTTGMFALFEVDNKIKEILKKADVETMVGSACGDSRDSVRINLASTNKKTQAMVRDILKIDKKKVN